MQKKLGQVCYNVFFISEHSNNSKGSKNLSMTSFIRCLSSDKASLSFNSPRLKSEKKICRAIKKEKVKLRIFDSDDEK